jgi:endonuclease/exonuclease/phosphatase family metal-dependent hydrolase
MEVVRALTLNLWGEQEPLARRLELVVAAAQALAPDVIALQEVRVVPPSVPNTAETIAHALGYSYVFEKATPWGGGDEGLAILSRLPIARHAATELPHAVPTERRICLGASVATPAGDLAVFTTHLNYRLTDGGKREDQVQAVDAFVAGWESSLPKLLMGDFNAIPESDEIRFLRGQHTTAGRRTYYQDAYARMHADEAGQAGYTWARRNPYTARLAFLEPDRRIDYIFVTPLARDGRGTVHACRIVLDEPAADGAWGSDHFGLYAEVQLVPNPVAA